MARSPAFGFAKEGRSWYHAKLDLLYEAPAPEGLPGEVAPRTEIEIDGLRVVIIRYRELARRTCRRSASSVLRHRDRIHRLTINRLASPFPAIFSVRQI